MNILNIHKMEPPMSMQWEKNANTFETAHPYIYWTQGLTWMHQPIAGNFLSKLWVTMLVVKTKIAFKWNPSDQLFYTQMLVLRDVRTNINILKFKLLEKSIHTERHTCTLDILRQVHRYSTHLNFELLETSTHAETKN